MPRAKNEPVVYSVTSASTSTTDDQDQRVRRYLTMMGIRIVCFGLVFVTSGWLRWSSERSALPVAHGRP